MNDILSALERYRPLIGDWDAFLRHVERPLPTTFWVNPLRDLPDRVSAELRACGLQPEPAPWDHPGAFRLPPDTTISHHLLYLTGAYHQQEEASLLPVRLLDPQPGERVLDMCAAPGGKTLQIAAAMANRGTVVANDISRKRLRAIRSHLDRLGLINVAMTRANASNLSADIGTFDRILADVPCSCLGTSRKSLAAHRWELDVSLKLVGLQESILRRAVQLCRRGGRIVYATCTYAPEENEAVVSTILNEFGAALRLCPPPDLGLDLQPGLTEWQGTRYHPDLRHTRRLWPHLHDTGGFFVAVLECQDGPATAEVSPMSFDQEGVAEHLPELMERYGLPEHFRRDYIIYRANRKFLHLLPAHFRPPPHPVPESMGLRFMQVRGRLPKLTSEAARLIAPLASRGTLALTPQQTLAALRRQTFQLQPEQVEQAPLGGFLILTSGRHVLGLGLRRHPDLLESMVPKALEDLQPSDLPLARPE